MLNRSALSTVFTIAMVLGLICAGFWFWIHKAARRPEVIYTTRWDESIFRSADETLSRFEIGKLRETPVSKDDIEVRVWREGRHAPLEAVFLRRTSGVWSAMHLVRDEPPLLSFLPSPRSGWRSFWRAVEQKGILDLAHRPEEDCEDLDLLHPDLYVVEVTHERTYKNYMYVPAREKCAEAKQMNDIAEMIVREFGSNTDECKLDAWIKCYGPQKFWWVRE